MLGIMTSDDTHVWLDERGIRVAGPIADFWLKKVDRNHSLPDCASRFRFERDHPATIAEPVDIQRHIASHGELVNHALIQEHRLHDAGARARAPSPDSRQDPRTGCANRKVIAKPVSR